MLRPAVPLRNLHCGRRRSLGVTFRRVQSLPTVERQFDRTSVSLSQRMPSMPIPPAPVDRDTGVPEISLVMPCYNEEAIVGQTIRRTLAAFRESGHRLQLVAVDNGSSDRTGEIIREFVDAGYPVVAVRVEQNKGYGFGILSGIPAATAPWIGFIPADSQVDAHETVHLYEEALACEEPVLAKA
ncbi:MAG: glycosyltransferase, partial [Gemmatimonas sp.]